MINVLSEVYLPLDRHCPKTTDFLSTGLWLHTWGNMPVLLLEELRIFEEEFK